MTSELPGRNSHPQGYFATTHWSVVLAAAKGPSSQAQAALERLCRTYWYPLYASVRRRGYGPEEAQDLTQAFFAFVLEKQTLALANRQRGRFRTFLLTVLKNFLHREWEKARAEKRGGLHSFLSLDAQDAEGRYRAEPVDQLAPDRLYEKRWATTLLDQVMARLRQEFGGGERQALFDAISEHLWGQRGGASHKELAAQFGLSESNVGATIHRLRARFRELLRAEIAHTVATPADVDDELRYLAGILREPG